jgi:CRP-like cAMP-binding protein
MLSLLSPHAIDADRHHGDGSTTYEGIDFIGDAVELEPKERLFREGSRATALYYIVSGTIRAEICSDSFEHRVIGYFRRGDVLGFTHSDTMLYTATAETAAKVYCYPAKKLLKRFARDPRGAEAIARSSTSSLARMLALIAIVRVASPTQRVGAYLMSRLESSEAGSEAELQGDEPTIEMDVSPADLAALLGLSDFEIYDSLKELRTTGIIRLESPTLLTICDPERLEQLSLRSDGRISADAGPASPQEKPEDEHTNRQKIRAAKAALTMIASDTISPKRESSVSSKT